MRIKGFQGTSLLDFPGRISALIFTGNCNLRCGFCQNPGLVLNPDQYPDYPLDEIIDELSQRSSFIDGVVITGGEPTLASDLPRFLEQVKALGLEVKLDTNGLLPEVIAGLLGQKLIDYLAIDIKTSPRRYAELHKAEVDTSALLTSCLLAIEKAPEYEFRTTCVPGLITTAELSEIGALIKGARRWVLQQYVPRAQMLGDAPEEAYSSAEFRRFCQIAETYVAQVEGRGW